MPKDVKGDKDLALIHFPFFQVDQSSTFCLTFNLNLITNLESFRALKFSNLARGTKYKLFCYVGYGGCPNISDMEIVKERPLEPMNYMYLLS